jgi:polar amino acid transport system ATP-binding protein
MTQDALALEAQGVCKAYGDNAILRGVDLSVAQGQVVCVIGPSGAGKSTFLRCINHLEVLDAGRIRAFGELIGYTEEGDRLREMRERDVARQRARMAMVFQSFNLWAHMSVLQNLMEAPVRVKREPAEEVKERAIDLLAQVGLAGKADRYPSQLSGGEQQRVGIARALAMRPSLMLFDEPTSALDPELVGDVLEVMRSLAQSGMTMIVVTHEIGFARDVADVVAFMEGGVIAEVGPAKAVLDNPQAERTQLFLNRFRNR